jgi:hypothetical protein
VGVQGVVPYSSLGQTASTEEPEDRDRPGSLFKIAAWPFLRRSAKDYS